MVESTDATSVVESKFVEIERLLISEADFGYYVFGLCSKLLKYRQTG